MATRAPRDLFWSKRRTWPGHVVHGLPWEPCEATHNDVAENPPLIITKVAEYDVKSPSQCRSTQRATPSGARDAPCRPHQTHSRMQRTAPFLLIRAASSLRFFFTHSHCQLHSVSQSSRNATKAGQGENADVAHANCKPPRAHGERERGALCAPLWLYLRFWHVQWLPSSSPRQIWRRCTTLVRQSIYFCYNGAKAMYTCH